MIAASGSLASRKSLQARLPDAAEAPLERLQRERRVDLVAPALAEDPADQRRLGDHVGELPGLRRLAGGGVLGGQQQRVRLGRVDVGVDPVDVVLGVWIDLRAGGAVQLRREVDLGLEVLLGVRRDRPLRLVHLAVGRRAAGERRELAAGGVAQHVDQEQPVLGGRIAGAEHHLGARVAVDVRDVVALSRTIVSPGSGDPVLDLPRRRA